MYKLCKTEQSAIRQRELELALAEMMNQQRYEEITVSEFCSHAGIPRKAFYRYFSSKDGALYALIDHTMLQYVGFRTPSALKDADNVIRELESFYQFWKDRQAFLDALKFSGLIGVMLERAINSIDQMVVLKKPRPGDTEFAQRHITRFAISGIMIMMVNWHNEGFRESPREMAELTARLVMKPLFPYLMDII